MAAKTWFCPLCSRDALEIPEPLRLLETTPPRVAEAAGGIPDADLTRRPVPGQWTVQEVVAHLADAEFIWGFRYRKVLAEEDAEIALYREDLFATNLAPHNRPMLTLLDSLRNVRAANLALLRAMPEERWRRQARHPKQGFSLSAHQLAQHNFHHDENHLAQLRAARTAVGR